jgi:hypothetical protein
LPYGEERSSEKERAMERRVEVVAGLGATVFGLIAVVMEAQAVSNPLANPSLSWLLGMNRFSGVWNAILTTQHALLPMAIVLAALAFGGYLHGVHRKTAGLALVVSSSSVVIAVAGFVVFNSTYVQILFVPPPLVVLTAVLAAVASVSALSSLRWPPFLSRRVSARPASARRIQPHEGM